MARKQDEMSLDDELAAAFMDDNSGDMLVEEEPVDTPVDTQNTVTEQIYEEEVAIGMKTRISQVSSLLTSTKLQTNLSSKPAPQVLNAKISMFLSQIIS